MTDLALLLDLYPALSPEERLGVEARVAAAPEWAEALDEAQRFAALLDAAGPRPAPPPAGGDGQAADPEDEAERDAARLRALLAHVEDPARKFERLTGRSLPSPPEPPAPPRPVDGDRGRAGRWVAGVVAGAAVLWGGVAAASSAATPERTRVADVAALAHVGPIPSGGADRVVARLGRALDEATQARRFAPGQPPQYDADALASAATDLAWIAARAEPGSAVAQEARLAQGRVLLQLGRDADAARALGALVREGGYRAPEARRLLDWVRAGRGTPAR